MKNEVENAILYIRDYVQAYNERSASAVARKLMDAVNVVIENYNTDEVKGVDLENEKLTRDMFMSLAFGEYIKWINIEDAMRVPMQYYIKRISEHHLDVDDINKRFLYAYNDHRALVRFKEDLKRELDWLEELHKILKSQKTDEGKDAVNKQIIYSENYIENIRERVRAFE